MKNKLIILGAVIILMILTACNDLNSTNDEIVTITSISGITVPAYSENPVTTITETDQFTGTVTWSDSPTTFAAETIYTATITLSAKSGYTLNGIAENFFSISGATSVTNDSNSEIITAVFPATGSAPLTVVNISSISGIIVPAYGENPVTTITETDQFTGTVIWSDSPTTFAADTVYTATINLTAKTGYTFTGISENFFNVSGANSVTSSTNSGVITAIFPITEIIIPTNGLLAYYPFNGNANDESGNGHNGTVTDAVLTTDRLGNENEAYSFDGDGDYINIPDPGWSTNGPFSISLWIKTPDEEQAGCFFSYREDSSPFHQIVLDISSGGQNPVSGKKINALWFPGRAYAYTDSDFINGEWHHIVVIFDFGTAIYIYIDGQLVNTTESYTGWTALTDTRPVQIGANNRSDGAYCFKGLIDEVCVYNRVISEDEIHSLYGK